MHLCSLFYGHPVEEKTRDYAEEIAQLVNGGYISQYEFGYKRDGKRVLCWQYNIRSDGTVTADDRPGKIDYSVDVTGATFYTFLVYSLKWVLLSGIERERIEQNLPVQRTTGNPPADGNGYWTSDRGYSTAGVGFARNTFRPFS